MRFLLNLAAFYLRHTPIEKGRWRILHWALPRSKALLSQREYRVVKTRSNFLMRVDLGDWLGRHVFVSGEYEPSTTSLIQALLQSGDAMVDIGANAGFFSLLGAQCVGSSGKVLAFEPMPSTRASLLENIRLNGYRQIEVREEAVFNSTGTCEFNEGPTHHSGVSSLRVLPHSSKTIQVATAPLDSLLSPTQAVSLIKLDVEGAEFQALEGMQELLRRQHPDLIVEVTDEYLRGMGHSAEELRNLLEEIGYKMYRIEHHEVLVSIPKDGDIPAGQFNALFSIRESFPPNFTVVTAQPKSPSNF